MGENTSPVNNPWGNLSTVTSFDRGNDVRTTRRLDNNNDTQSNRQIVGVVAPSTSLLIESLIQQLCTMFEGDEVRRNKLYFAICDRLHELQLIDGSYNMMEFETLRGQYQQALYHLVTVARASTGSESALQVPSCLMAEWSRYRREFQEISFIAGGGFGNVFKALHRLDGSEYAIKKIVVHSGRVKSIMQHLEEVKTLAKLNHTNIVSYKGAWIEPTLPSTFLPSLPSTDRVQRRQSISENIRHSKSYRSQASRNFETQSQSYTSSNRSYHSHVENSKQNISCSINKKSGYITGMYIYSEIMEPENICGSGGSYIVSHDKINERFHTLNSSTNIIGQRITEKDNAEICIEETNSNSVSFRNDSKDKSNNNNNNTENDGNYSDVSDSYEESNSNRKVCVYVPRLNQQYATLYIQMELCEKTLQHWLDERIDTTPQPVINMILTQILQGLEYIHSRGIVHHDIKPSNIFITTSRKLQIQLGDFGLACPLQRETHHTVLGTHMYAAPEQLEGKCDPKSDLYSVGIVLLELLVRTNTHMERVEIISELKKGQIPSILTANYPKRAHMLSQLVQKDPNKRPSTSQLLQDLIEDKDVTIAELRNNIVQKDETIQKLQEKISMLEAQIMKLQTQKDT